VGNIAAVYIEAAGESDRIVVAPEHIVAEVAAEHTADEVAVEV
jgi:hypothetical protein